MIRYARTPSPQFIETLKPGGFMSPLLEDRTVCGLRIDPHLRERDHLHLYCGLTRLVDAWPVRGGIRVAAHETYSLQPCGDGLFRTWNAEETGLADALAQYFNNVQVRPAYVLGEGQVQSAWASVTFPWIPFDREAVLGYADVAGQKAGRRFDAFAEARAEVARLGSGGWTPPPKDKVGAELDQLAVDPNGNLVLIELKDAGASPDSVYYSPLQLLQYVHEWATAFKAVRVHLDSLIAARRALGLSPTDIPNLGRGLRPVVGFGKDVRSAEVRTRFGDVLAVANRHLPENASPIEAWTIEKEGRPVRVL